MDVHTEMPSDAECAQMKAGAETLYKAAKALAEQIGIDVNSGALTILANAASMGAAGAALNTEMPDQALGYFAQVAANAVSMGATIHMKSMRDGGKSAGSQKLANLTPTSKALN